MPPETVEPLTLEALESLLNTAEGIPVELDAAGRSGTGTLLPTFSKPVATTVTRISSDMLSSNAVPQMMFASG